MSGSGNELVTAVEPVGVGCRGARRALSNASACWNFAGCLGAGVGERRGPCDGREHVGIEADDDCDLGDVAIAMFEERFVIAEPVLVDELERDDERPAVLDGPCSPVMRRRFPWAFGRHSSRQGACAGLSADFGPVFPQRTPVVDVEDPSVRANHGRCPALAVGSGRGRQRDHALRLDGALPVSARWHRQVLEHACAELLHSHSAQGYCTEVLCTDRPDIASRRASSCRTSATKPVRPEVASRRVEGCVQRRADRVQTLRADIACRHCVQACGFRGDG